MKIHLYYLGIGTGLNYPNGLGVLSSVLENCGHRVSATYLFTHEALGKTINADMKRFCPDIVGLSVVTNQAQYLRPIVRAIRSQSEATIIAGGIHATAAPEECVKEGIDYVFRGEAEESLVEFLDRFSPGRSIDIRGVWPNPAREFTDVNKIPQEKKELFHNIRFAEIISANRGLAGEVIASRGCRYSCGYCYNATEHAMYSELYGAGNYPRIRFRQVQQVIAELKDMAETYHSIRAFVFGDDTFYSVKKYYHALLEAYRDRISIPFTCNMHLNCMENEKLASLKSSGCWEIKVGIESGSARIRRDLLGRKMTSGQIRDRIQAAIDAGLKVSTFNMIALPTESEEELLSTLQFNARIAPNRIKLSIYYPYPSTPLRTYCEEHNLICHDKLSTLPDYQTDTPLKFTPSYLALLSDVWNRPDVYVNNYSHNSYYQLIPGLKGMIVKKQDYIEHNVAE